MTRPVEEQRGRGRPRKGGLVVSVRVDNDAYDEICRLALKAGADVRTVMRHALTQFALQAKQRGHEPVDYS